jgi:hypothetical protein
MMAARHDDGVAVVPRGRPRYHQKMEDRPSIVARQSGWEGSDNQDGHFGGRGDVIIVAAQR